MVVLVRWSPALHRRCGVSDGIFLGSAFSASYRLAPVGPDIVAVFKGNRDFTGFGVLCGDRLVELRLLLGCDRVPHGSVTGADKQATRLTAPFRHTERPKIYPTGPEMYSSSAFNASPVRLLPVPLIAAIKDNGDSSRKLQRGVKDFVQSLI